jgi:hypothetical protein
MCLENRSWWAFCSWLNCAVEVGAIELTVIAVMLIVVKVARSVGLFIGTKGH